MVSNNPQLTLFFIEILFTLATAFWELKLPRELNPLLQVFVRSASGPYEECEEEAGVAITVHLTCELTGFLMAAIYLLKNEWLPTTAQSV